jgi:hypothetical protein
MVLRRSFWFVCAVVLLCPFSWRMFRETGLTTTGTAKQWLPPYTIPYHTLNLANDHVVRVLNRRRIFTYKDIVLWCASTRTGCRNCYKRCLFWCGWVASVKQQQQDLNFLKKWGETNTSLHDDNARISIDLLIFPYLYMYKYIPQ